MEIVLKHVPFKEGIKLQMDGSHLRRCEIQQKATHSDC
jgi:hypothetical protein